MGRSYFVEETVGQYLSELTTTKSKPLVTGLLVGQCSPQRDYVILAIQTPPKDEESRCNARYSSEMSNLDEEWTTDEDSNSNASYNSELSNIDEEWTTAHANQVSRMLPGGLLVLGVFTVAIPELSKEIQNILRKLVFSVEKSLARKRLWSISEEDVSDRVALHLCSATKKRVQLLLLIWKRILCRTYDIQDPKSTAKPADWKYQNSLSTSWLSLECTVNANIHIPLLATSACHELEKNIWNGLTRWAKQIEEADILINGQLKEEDAILVDNQKKSGKGITPSATESLNAMVLTKLSQKSNSRSTATVQICSGSINLKGVLKCKAYIRNNKPKVKDAVKALKRDIISTLSDRCEILFEDLLMDEVPDKKSLEREYYTLPCRVFAPITGSCVLVCDYKFGSETDEEIQERFLELLDQDVQAKDLHPAEKMSTVEVIPPKEFPDDIQHKQLTKQTLLLKLRQNIGVVIAVAVAISAAAFSFNYFSD